MTNTLLRFYRTTEGLVITLVLYVAAAYGIFSAFPAADGGPVILGALVALTSLVFAGVGFFLYSDAIQRVLDTLTQSSAGFFNEVMGV